MEIKEAEKIRVAKPVAWRPGISKFKSFSVLLSGSVDASPPTALSEISVAAIRPKTLRFKPVCRAGLPGADAVASATSEPPIKVLEPGDTSKVVYKPVAKLVSKMTASLFANVECDGTGLRGENTENVANIQPPDAVKNQNELKSDLDQNFHPQPGRKDKNTPENSEHNKVDIGDQTGYEGHNWRKYGQKQVKGSEYPRSYYKCTHPNCPVKKKVERMEDGRIAEIVYKGDHNHSISPPIKCTPPDGQVQRSASDATQDEGKSPSQTNQPIERIAGHHGRSEQRDKIELYNWSNFSCAAAPIVDPKTAVTCNASVSTSNNSFGPSREFEEATEALEVEGIDFKSKRRKGEHQSLKVGTEGEAKLEPRIVVEKNTDTEITGDGFRWRKYGQKVVKGNTYPRSYYRCTSPKCNVRKYVERTSDESQTFITTYEGRHNHDMPIRGTNSEAFKKSCKNKIMSR